MSRRFTIFGGSGFIGSHLVDHLRRGGADVTSVTRGDRGVFGAPMGHVIYCIGVTADFRRRSLDTFDAHVCALIDILRHASFESLLYLSSTRLYLTATSTDPETSFTVRPSRPDDLYAISKLGGEALCLTDPRQTVRIARLSNVYGLDWQSENFLSSIIRSALDAGEIVLQSSPESRKDYVAVEDVVPVLERIAVSGRRRVYNVASGARTTAGELVQRLVELTGCTFRVEPDSPTNHHPEIDISTLREEFDFQPAGLAGRLPKLVESFRDKRVELEGDG